LISKTFKVVYVIVLCGVIFLLSYFAGSGISLVGELLGFQGNLTAVSEFVLGLLITVGLIAVQYGLQNIYKKRILKKLIPLTQLTLTIEEKRVLITDIKDKFAKQLRKRGSEYKEADLERLFDYLNIIERRIYNNELTASDIQSINKLYDIESK